MQRSSNSIASLAAALAKAQGELVNPEKSLVATIRADGPGAAERSFRYAPLSSGLDIVRKTLGQHEIATVQTTAIDQSAGIVNLTTVLAHSSGEWIASDWPVCAISETARPHRMGAALTYARRYALFTLVGIAGEDDLDSSDLMTPTGPTSQPKDQGNDQLNGGQERIADQTAAFRGRRDRRPSPTCTKPVLRPEQSAALCDRLLGELSALGSSDDAALWAHRSLPEKNRLTAPDALRIEEAFHARIIMHGASAEAEPEAGGQTMAPPPGAIFDVPRSASGKGFRANRVARALDKSALAFPEPRRIRDPDHVRYVATQPCLICGRQPCDAHHLRFAQRPALGRKVSDEFTVPLCRGHHREIHRRGDEATWWGEVGIDAAAAARVLWLKTHPLPVTIDRTIQAGAISAVAADPSNPLSDLQGAKAVRLGKRSQLLGQSPHDLLQTDRGQPPKWAEEHRADHS